MDSGKQTTFPGFRTDESRRRYLAAYAQAQADWPVPHDDLEIRTRLGTTHVIASGPKAAPPLILLPSFAGTALAWRPNVAALAHHWRTYSIDTIGQPGRSFATRRLRDRSDYAGWLAEVMDSLGVSRASLVGCSYGGWVAANQALSTPERVERLVLIGPVGVFVGMSPGLALKMRAGALAQHIRSLLGDRRTPNANTLHAGAAPIHPADENWRKLMSVAMAERAAVSLARPTTFAAADFARVTAPTLLLIGEFERLYDARSVLARAAELLPGLQAELVEGADHIAAMSQPASVNTRIAAFLRG